jgi:predicted transcriptional regulator of viral defense system
VAAALLADETYYLGGLWAFSAHRLTEQQYGSQLDAFVTRRRRNRVLSNAKLNFHVLPRKEFSSGLQTIQFEGAMVWVSTPERTVLDAFDYPMAVGGIRTALLLVSSALDRIDVRGLIDLAAERSQISTCQRLGVLLERRGTPSDQLGPLKLRVPPTHPATSMLPDAPRKGHTSPTWRIVENDK